MLHQLSRPVWHVFSEKDFSPVSKRLKEYSIPHDISKEKSLVPNHAAIVVSDIHFSKATKVILRDFGRRTGVD